MWTATEARAVVADWNDTKAWGTKPRIKARKVKDNAAAAAPAVRHPTGESTGEAA
jgi:hypothetical protein